MPYCFGISYEHPGTFILSYIRSTTPHHEFIGIHPKGFKFRKQIFNNIEQLLAYFQNHIYDTVEPAKNRITNGPFREPMSGGWSSNNVAQHNQSIGNNDRGDDNGAGFGRGRGLGRSCGGRGRGRGFSPRSGSQDDGVNDGNGFTSQQNTHESWRHAGGSYRGSSCGGQGQGQGRGRRGRQGDGQGRGSEHDRNRNNYSDKWGSGGNSHSDTGGWENSNSFGWKDNTGRGWGEGGPDEGYGGGTTNSRQQNSHESWRHADGSRVSYDSGRGQGEGQGRGRGRGRKGGRGDGRGRESELRNSFGWKDNIGKGWGEGGPGESYGGGTTSFGQQNSQESWGHADGTHRASNDSGWGQGEGQGRGRGRERRRRGGRGDGRGRGSEHDWNRNRNGDSNKWGCGGNSHSSSGGWENANSFGWKDNIGNGRGEGGPGESYVGGTTSFGQQNSQESWGHAGGTHRASNDSGWGPGEGHGRGRRGGRGDGRGRGSGRWGGNTESGNENSGWRAAHGKNATPSGGGSGWGGNGGKSW